MKEFAQAPGIELPDIKSRFILVFEKELFTRLTVLFVICLDLICFEFRNLVLILSVSGHWL